MKIKKFNDVLILIDNEERIIDWANLNDIERLKKREAREIAKLWNEL